MEPRRRIALAREAQCAALIAPYALRDAVKHITSLPRAEQNAEHWRPAATLLGLIGENGGCVVFARIAMMYGLRKGAKGGPPKFDPERSRDRPWGKRKLKRDE